MIDFLKNIFKFNKNDIRYCLFPNKDIPNETISR